MNIERPRILVVDDELPICLNCKKILARLDYDVDYALDGRQALKQFEAAPFDLVITDLKMGRMGGMEVLQQVRTADPDVMVIVITGYSTVSSAVEVMKTGAFDYLPKPFTPQELRAVVVQALAEREGRLHRRRLRQGPPSGDRITHQLVGNSPSIRKVINMVAKVAPTDSTVLIAGESGTGKELIARAVHANSNRSDRVFFAVDCGTLAGGLLENELFGHVQGAFTGAHRDKEGIFQKADGGTVFLDEIGNISLDVQGKLLRFLEAREFISLGATTPRRVDVRLIFATNQDLDRMVATGTFRNDFYYRIFVYPIYLPTLRDRRSDIDPIARHFLALFARQMGKSIDGIDAGALQRLNDYHWPGNVRELRNVIERAVILCDGETLTVREIRVPQTGNSNDTPPPPAVPETNAALKEAKKAIREQAVAEIEQSFVLQALRRCDWNVSQAAREVGLQRSNLQALMKKYGIRRPSPTATKQSPA